jgi:hypothetical protein
MAFVLVNGEWHFAPHYFPTNWRMTCGIEPALCQEAARGQNNAFKHGRYDSRGNWIEKTYSFCVVPQ